LNAEIISTESYTQVSGAATEEELESELRRVFILPRMHGLRLDKCLAELLPEFSRSYLQQLLLQGDVANHAGVLGKASAKAQAGQQISVNLRPTPQAQAFKPEPVQLDIVFEDEHVLVVNKRAGLVVHPAAGNWSGTVLNGLLMHHRAAVDLPRAGIVHRLDKDTSGLMMVGKTRQAVDELGRQIAQRSVQRYYLALAERPWRRGSGVVSVDQFLGRDPVNRLRMAVLRADNAAAKAATTWVKRLGEGSHAVLVGCKLFTGRTHQIRVHLAWLGHPIVGDSIYGGHTTEQLNRQALHATRLDFSHPVSGHHLSFTTEVPVDMQQAFSAEGLHYNHSSLGPATFGLPPG
jgi:23S rRNA pseudouridine1911/1915/1917 synthase